MHAQLGPHSNLLPCLACAVLALVAIVPVSTAQQVRLPPRLQFGLAAPPHVPQLTEARLDLIAGTTAARLEQAQALVANGEFDDAVAIYRELLTKQTERVVAVGDHRFVSLRTYCHMQLARLPAEALALYRGQVDPTAERLYREGIAGRDDAPLRRVVDEMYCSSWGDDALLGLGELALERGQYSAARRSWEQISPLLRDPSGRSTWLALHGIDLNAHWPEIERRWNDRATPPDWLAYPDTDFELADIRARMVLVSVREGQLDPAAFELGVFRRFHPQATGRFGGQDGAYAQMLERLLTTAREWPKLPPDADWPTFAGSPSRVPSAAPIDPNAAVAWSKPIGLKPMSVARQISPLDLWQREFGGRITVDVSQDIDRLQRPLSFFPVAVQGVVLYGNGSQVRAVDVTTGKPAITADGILYRGEAVAASGPLERIVGRGAATSGIPRFSMTVADGVAYARVGRVVTSAIRPERGPTSERLIGLDLNRDGLLTFQVKPDDETWSFDGAPLGDGRNIFVAMRRGDVAPRAYVACFDAATGQRRWRTSIGTADTLAAGQADEITHNLLALVDDRIYFNTNLGLVAALDSSDGRIAWIHRYERATDLPTTPPTSGPTHFDRDPSPCMVARDMVFVAPSDTSHVFALDASTGQPIWRSVQFPGVAHLLGVVDDRLILTGNQYSSVDVRTGRTPFAWPESEHSGIRGRGRGVLAGREAFWPTRNEIYVFDAITGEQTRSPIPLQSIGNNGANLIAANGLLIAAGPDRLMAFGPQHVPEKPPQNTGTEPIAGNERLTRE